MNCALIKRLSPFNFFSKITKANFDPEKQRYKMVSCCSNSPKVIKKTVVCTSIFEYTVGRYDQCYLTQIKSNQFIYGRGTRIKRPTIPDQIVGF